MLRVHRAERAEHADPLGAPAEVQPEPLADPPAPEIIPVPRGDQPWTSQACRCDCAAGRSATPGRVRTSRFRSRRLPHDDHGAGAIDSYSLLVLGGR